MAKKKSAPSAAEPTQRTRARTKANASTKSSSNAAPTPDAPLESSAASTSADDGATFLGDDAPVDDYDDSHILVEQTKEREFLNVETVDPNLEEFDELREQECTSQFANSLYEEQFYFSDMFGEDDNPEDGSFDDNFDEEFEELSNAEFDELFPNDDEDEEDEEEEEDAANLDDDFDSMNSEENVYEDDD